MSDILATKKDNILYVNNPADIDTICKISHALAAPMRVQILHSILKQSKNLSDIATELKLPLSSVARHIEILADAQIIYVDYQPGLKGHTKYCSQAIRKYTISLESNILGESNQTEYTVEVPIGLYSHCHIKAPCGINSKEGTLGEFDDPSVFFLPERKDAQLLWFNQGFISYNFPSPKKLRFTPQSISFSFELCSETVYYNNTWPSDITVSINGIEVLTITSEGDFGGRRGKFTPDYWPITSTQFGVLKTVTINQVGVHLNNSLVHKKIKIDDLHLFDGNAISFSLGIKEDALHKGGINLFGEHFGDHPQAIIMKIK